MTPQVPVDMSDWWDPDLPALTTRIAAFLTAVLTLGIEHELEDTLAAEPTLTSYREDRQDLVWVDVYRVWYVLHHGRLDEDRHTLVYKRRLHRELVPVEDLKESSIMLPVLPLDPGWETADAVHTDPRPQDGDLQ